MGLRSPRLLGLSLLLALAWLAPPGSAQEAGSDPESLHRQLDEANAEIDRIQSEADSVDEKIAAIDREAAAVQKALAASEALVSLTQSEIAVLRLEIQDKEKEFDRAQDQVRDVAIQLYKAGPTAELDIILSVSNITELSSVLDYAQAVDADRSQAMVASLRLKAELVQDRKRFEATLSEAQEALAQQSLQSQHLADLRRAQSLKQSDLEAEVVEAQKEADAISAASNAIQDQLSGSSIGATNPGGFAWPWRGAITSGFGPRWGSFHEGIDIDCVTGDSIGASKAGTVISATYDSGYGYYIVIDHGGGFATLYAHNSELYVGAGDSVSQGDAISACGSTGHSTGDHLHFEVRVNGSPQDPMGYLP